MKQKQQGNLPFRFNIGLEQQQQIKASTRLLEELENLLDISLPGTLKAQVKFGSIFVEKVELPQLNESTAMNLRGLIKWDQYFTNDMTGTLRLRACRWLLDQGEKYPRPRRSGLDILAPKLNIVVNCGAPYVSKTESYLDSGYKSVGVAMEEWMYLFTLLD